MGTRMEEQDLRIKAGMLLICERAWKKGEVPDDWKKAIIVPLYKGKGRGECSSYRG